LAGLIFDTRRMAWRAGRWPRRRPFARRDR